MRAMENWGKQMAETEMRTEGPREDNQIRVRETPVIIPAYEPDERMLALLDSLEKENFHRIVLVDDGSGGAYRQLFDKAQKEYPVVVLRHSINMGKGRALKTAFDYCLQRFPDAVGCITADSDGQHSVSCILDCAEALLENPEALIMGCRCFEHKDVPARSGFGNKCTRAVMKYLAGVSVSDTQTGLRGIPAAFMRELLSVKGERFEFETNMLMETRTKKIPIIEVPIETIYIEKNKTSHFNPIKDSARIYMIFGKFLFSSLSSSVVDLVLFSIFCYFLKEIEWKGISYIFAATVFARILSALYNFTLNYKVVFQSDSPVEKTMPRYILLAVLQMSCSAFLVNAIYPIFGGAEVLVKIPVDVLLFFLSFFLQREFVYK